MSAFDDEYDVITSDDFSDTIPEADFEDHQKTKANISELHALKNHLDGKVGNRRKRGKPAKRDRKLNITKPIISSNTLASGASTPFSEATSANSSDFETPFCDGEGEANLDKLDSMNRNWNDLRTQCDAMGDEMTNKLNRYMEYQKSLEDVQNKIEVLYAALKAPFSSERPLQEQMDKIEDVLSEIENVKEQFTDLEYLCEDLFSEKDEKISNAFNLLESAKTMAHKWEKKLKLFKLSKEDHDSQLKEAFLKMQSWEMFYDDALNFFEAEVFPTFGVEILEDQLLHLKEVNSEIDDKMGEMGEVLNQTEFQNLFQEFSEKILEIRANYHSLKVKAQDFEVNLHSVIRQSKKREENLQIFLKEIDVLQKWIADNRTFKEPFVAPINQGFIKPRSLLDENIEYDNFLKDVKANSIEALHSDWSSDSDASLIDLKRKINRRKDRLGKQMKRVSSSPQIFNPSTDFKLPEVKPPTNFESQPQTRNLHLQLKNLTKYWNSIINEAERGDPRVKSVEAIEENYLSALQQATEWLELLESQIPSSQFLKTIEEQIIENECVAKFHSQLQSLYEELRNFEAEFSALSEACGVISNDASAKSYRESRELIVRLSAKVQQLEDDIKEKEDNLNIAALRRKEFENELDSILEDLCDLRKEVLSSKEESTDRKTEHENDEANDRVHNFHDRLNELEDRLSQVESNYGERSLEIMTIKQLIDDVFQFILESKANMSKRADLKSQFEKMLEEYHHFIDSSEKQLVIDDDIAMEFSDLMEIKNLLHKHKDFFEDIDGHWYMVNHIYEKLDESSKNVFSSKLSTVNGLTQKLKLKMHKQGTTIEIIAYQWKNIENDLQELVAMVTNLESQIPSNDQPLSTLKDVLQLQTTLKEMNQMVLQKESFVEKVLDESYSLTRIIKCSALASRVESFTDSWLDIRRKLTKWLEKLKLLSIKWEHFEENTRELKVWLQRTSEKISFWRKKKPHANSDYTRFTDQLLEIERHMSNQVQLMKETNKEGDEIKMINPPSEISINETLSYFESTWQQLDKTIQHEKNLIQSKRLKLFSIRQLMIDMNLWLESVDISLRDEKDHSLNITNQDLLKKLNKYKGINVELTSRQMVLDYINQDSIRHSPQRNAPSETKLDKQIGEINKHWHNISDHVSKQIKILEAFRTRLGDYTHYFNSSFEWMSLKRVALNRLGSVGYMISVQQSLHELTNLEDDLKKQSTSLEKVHALGQQLVFTNGFSNIVVAENDTKLSRLKNALEMDCRQIRGKLECALEEWKSYQDALGTVTRFLLEMEYSLSHYQVIHGDLLSFRTHVQKFKSVQREFQTNKSSLDHLGRVTIQLFMVCDSTIGKDVKQTHSNLSLRWRELSCILKGLENDLQNSLKNWQKFENEFNLLNSTICKHSETLEKLQQKVNSLHRTSSDKNELGELSLSAKHLQRELESIQFDLINNISERLTCKMDNSTALHFKSDIESLTMRRNSLLISTERVVATTNDHTRRNLQISNEANSLNKFLNDIERRLEFTKNRQYGTNHHHEDFAAPILQQALCELNVREIDLTQLMHNARGLPSYLFSQYSQLQSRWKALQTQIRSASTDAQLLRVKRQSFSQKSDDLVRFLKESDRKFDFNCLYSFEDVNCRYSTIENVQTELINRQLVFESICEEGEAMMRSRGLRNAQDIQNKINALKYEWSAHLSKVQTKKEDVYKLLEKSMNLQALSLSVDESLTRMNDEQRELSLHLQSIDKIRLLKEKLLTFTTNLRRQSDSINGMKDICTFLRPLAANCWNRELANICKSYETRWIDLHSCIQKQTDVIEGVLLNWSLCESSLSELQQSLLNIKSICNCPFPLSRDDILAAVDECKNAEVSLKSSQQCFDQLKDSERYLSAKISSQSMQVMNERISLISKQWTEMASQINSRSDNLKLRLKSWEQFNSKVEIFLQEIKDIELKIGDCKFGTLFDQYENLTKDLKGKINAAEESKNKLTQEGKLLCDASRPLESSEIEQGLKMMTQRWSQLQELFMEKIKKVKETLEAVQKLDSSINKLRSWLSTIEADVSAPLVVPSFEIQFFDELLEKQKDIECDISKHSDGVKSILRLCDVLTSDVDASANHIELQNLTSSAHILDKRWRAVSAQTNDRRIKIEQIKGKCRKFKGDCEKFEKQLKTISNELSQIEGNYQAKHQTSSAAVTLQNVQHTANELLTHLEHLNQQYRSMSSSGDCIDASPTARESLQNLNVAWSDLCQRVSVVEQKFNVIQRQKEELNTSCKKFLLRLGDIEVKLTSLEQKFYPDQQELHKLQRSMDMQKSTYESMVRLAQELDEVSDSSSEGSGSQREMANLIQLYNNIDQRLKKLYKKQYADARVSTKTTDTMSSVPYNSSQSLGGFTHESNQPRINNLENNLHSTPFFAHRPSLEGCSSKSSSHRDLSTQNLRINNRTSTLKPYNTTDKPRPTLLDLNELLRECSDRLFDMENALRATTPHQIDMDNVRKFSQLYSSTSEALDTALAVKSSIASQSSIPMDYQNRLEDARCRWESVKKRAWSKLNRMKENASGWSQFTNDLDSLNIWMEKAHGNLSSDKILDINDLERAIIKHKDFLSELDDKKRLLVSVNNFMKTYTVAQADRELINEVKHLNDEWDLLCQKASDWQISLQDNLLECPDYHFIIDNMFKFVERVEKDLRELSKSSHSTSREDIQTKFQLIESTKSDLERQQNKVSHLRAMTDHLFLNRTSANASKRGLHIVESRIKMLQSRCDKLYASTQHSKNLRNVSPSPPELSIPWVKVVGILGELEQAALYNSTSLHSSINTPRPSWFSSVSKHRLGISLSILISIAIAAIICICPPYISGAPSVWFVNLDYPMRPPAT